MRYSQIRERRSRVSCQDPPDRAVFGSGSREGIPAASIDGRSRIKAGVSAGLFRILRVTTRNS